MNGKPRITVAGAGALGLAIALNLADLGCEVAVYDPAPADANASGVAAGMLAPVFEAIMEPVAPLALFLAARDLWPSLEARLRIAVDRSGAAAVGDADFLGRTEAQIRALGLHPSLLGRATLESLAPGLAPGLTDAVLTREDWRIEPWVVSAALRRAAGQAGVAFHARAASGFEGADRLIIATGASRDLAVLAPALNVLSPVKGQIVTLQTSRSPGVALRTADGYALAGQGGLRLGATMEPGRGDMSVDPIVISGLMDAGLRLFPDLAEVQFTGQAGVRAASPDGLPLVGRDRHPGVLLAVGARRNGWLLAPLVARIIAACVVDADPGPHAAAFDPRRFS